MAKSKLDQAPEIGAVALWVFAGNHYDRSDDMLVVARFDVGRKELHIFGEPVPCFWAASEKLGHPLDYCD